MTGNLHTSGQQYIGHLPHLVVIVALLVLEISEQSISPLEFGLEQRRCTKSVEALDPAQVDTWRVLVRLPDTSDGRPEQLYISLVDSFVKSALQHALNIGQLECPESARLHVERSLQEEISSFFVDWISVK